MMEVVQKAVVVLQGINYFFDVFVIIKNTEQVFDEDAVSVGIGYIFFEVHGV